MTQLPPEAIAALESGKLIEAIKITRDRTGMDLKSSKDAVERYANRNEQERGAGAIGSAHGDANGSATEAGAMQGNKPAVPAAALAALARGHKVEAVRLTRDATGLGLADALKLVDAQLNPAAQDDVPLSSNRLGDPMAEPGRVPRSGFKWLPIAIVLLLFALAWVTLGKGF
jgi:ribosomal protein L7/L12